MPLLNIVRQGTLQFNVSIERSNLRGESGITHACKLCDALCFARRRSYAARSRALPHTAKPPRGPHDTPATCAHSQVAHTCAQCSIRTHIPTQHFAERWAHAIQTSRLLFCLLA
eukprot:6180569-Pleurochrysis_carterae.AAC.2